METIISLKAMGSQVRRDILRMVHGAKSGHPGGSLGCVELLVALYFDIMNHDPDTFEMSGLGQDVFLLSNGHISPAWYSVLARSGYFDIAELATFRKLNSRLQGHPATHEGVPGVRFASGSLGQGLSCAIGVALGKQLDEDENLVFVLMGDGEVQEGQVWEAAMFAGSKNVDNLIAIIDFNRKQIDGSTDDVMPLGDLKSKWETFGWKVLEMKGNDLEEVIDVLRLATLETGKDQPVMILMHTEMGFGVDFMMGTHKIIFFTLILNKVF